MCEHVIGVFILIGEERRIAYVPGVRSEGVFDNGALGKLLVRGYQQNGLFLPSVTTILDQTKPAKTFFSLRKSVCEIVKEYKTSTTK